MRSIKSNFEKISKNNPNLGAYPCLAMAVARKQFSPRSISKAYYELVPENEYVKSESRAQINHLDLLSNGPEECIKTA
ncbi:MAG: hypothetical protein KBB86_00715 [Candidatus Pacebacteria bacterium]|nr:hypothetical protein [Candidatus Paceibacterota bacterium]